MNFEIEIKKLIEVYSHSEDGISRFRDTIFNAQYEYYSIHGFPERCSLLELSLVPGHFQETNYDNIYWRDQHEDLRHLTQSFEVDCMFHNKGKTRKELTTQEFEQYIKFSSKAIDFALTRNNTKSSSISQEEFDELWEEIEKKESSKKSSFWSWLKGKA